MKLTSNRPTSSGKSRAEQTRQRRATTTKQATARVARNVVVPNNRKERVTPGVIVRGMGLGTPVVQKARNKGRRQYYYSLGNTGAEVRLPSMPMVNPGWRVLSALLVIILLAGLWFAYNNPMFQVSSMEISGIRRLKNSEILEVVDVRNKPVFAVHPAELKAALEEAFPELTDVQVTVSLPASVAISAVERQPAVLWKNGEQSFWIDPQGYVFEPRGSMEGLVVIQADSNPPVVLDSITPESLAAQTAVADEEAAQKAAEPVSVVRSTLDPVVLKAAIDLSKIIPAGTTLTYSARNGMGWADPRGWSVYVGADLSQIEEKMNVYQAVVNKLTLDGITPVMISVANVHAPFYRLEQ